MPERFKVLNTVQGAIQVLGFYMYREACSSANKAAANEIVKYDALSASHIFLPVAVDTAGTWNQSAIELIQEIGSRITFGVPVRALIYCSSKGERGRLSDTPSWSLFLLSLIFMPVASCWCRGLKIIIIY